ncbi:hypothetical protein FJY70_02965, partial [candidate division WOR-3 bacterium]|nr:hypothetical protein [candidate division WOR-3 bacterium]
MNITLLLLSVLSRPELAPVGPAEVAAAQRLRSEPAEAPKQSSAWDSPADAWAPGRFVVGCEPGAWDPAGQWAARQGGSVLRCDSAAGFVVVSLPGVSEARARELAAAAVQVSGIRYFEPSLWASAAALPNDPFFLPYQWDKWVTYADQAWDVVGGSMDVKVAVVDNGVDWQHPDLTASFRPGELGFDFIGNDDDPRPDNPNVPQSFHGTHVAGIIAATRNNNIGIAGWSLAQLLAVRVLNDSGSGTMDVVASGIRWAANRGA